VEESNHRYRGLLRVRRKRPNRRAAQKRDELAALHHEEFPRLACSANTQLVGTEN
jgi:hypothetical protein